MSRRHKNRTKEERIALLELIISEYEFNTKFGYTKSTEYYRNRVGIKVSNELFGELLSRQITPEEFLVRVNDYINSNPEKQKAVKAREEISVLVQKIYDLAKDNKKYIMCDMNATTIMEPDIIHSLDRPPFVRPTGKRLNINLTFAV